MHDAVQIRKQPIAEFQIFAADGLDLRVVQLAWIRNRRTVVVSNFDRTGVAGIPSPRQAQLPGTAMRAKQRAECSELKPSQVELGGELFRRNEASDVGSPTGNSG